LYDDIILVLRDDWGNSKLKFWVYKNLKLIKIGDQNVVYGIKSNHPIVTYQNLYIKIKECHERVVHDGRDKTWIELWSSDKHYNSNIYKQPRPVSTLLKGPITWLVHIHYNPKAIKKTEYSTLVLNEREPVLRCMTANFTSSHDLA